MLGSSRHPPVVLLAAPLSSHSTNDSYPANPPARWSGVQKLRLRRPSLVVRKPSPRNSERSYLSASILSIPYEPSVSSYDGGGEYKLAEGRGGTVHSARKSYSPEPGRFIIFRAAQSTHRKVERSGSSVKPKHGQLGGWQSESLSTNEATSSCHFRGAPASLLRIRS